MPQGLPPYDSNPDILYEICVALREGPMQQTELKKSDEISVGESTARLNIDYGVSLGFLEKGEGKEVRNTEKGSGLAWSGGPGNSEDSIELFKTAISSYDVYTRVLQIAATQSYDVIRDDECLTQDLIEESLSSIYDSSLDDRVKTAAANTFLKTLQAAGYGEYTIGRGGYQTRLVVDGDIEEYFEGYIDFQVDGDIEDSERDDAIEQSTGESVDVQASEIGGDESIEEILELANSDQIQLHVHYHMISKEGTESETLLRNILSQN